MENIKVLRAIVCGYERGGTTVLKQILCTHPKLNSGFECGLLLAPNPKDFLLPNYGEFNQSLIKNGWGINDADLEHICNAPNWNVAYLRLRERAHKIKKKDVLLVDKTPKYMKYLSDILVKFDEVKAIVIIKQPLGVIWSWIKRHQNTDKITPKEISAMCIRYIEYADGFNKAQKSHPKRILSIKYSDFCNETEKNVRRICEFLGLDFDPSMLEFKSEYGIKGNSVSPQYIEQYKQGLTRGQISQIVSETGGLFAGY